MASGFILHKASNPCPICEQGNNKNPKCKSKGELTLCMNLTDAIAVPGHKFIGIDSSRTWGRWLPDDRHWTDEQHEQHRRDNEARRQAREAAEAKQRAEALPAAQRDQEYRRILASLTLHPDDLADLQRRGFTPEQIERSGFKSVEQWQRLERPVNPGLAGANLDGTSLNVQPGYLCPIHDADGQLVGFQNRQREDGGYRWVSSSTKKRPNGPTPHNQDGELPLAVFEPEGAAAEHIMLLVEGTGPKPRLASDRLSAVVIGAAGAQWASSPKTLRRTVDKLAARHKAKRVVLYADAGMLDAPHKSVRDRYYATAELFQRWGYQFQVAWWGQTDKSHGDIDEISDFSQIRYISVDDLKALAGDEVQQRPQQRRKSYEERQTDRQQAQPEAKSKKAQQKEWRAKRRQRDQQQWLKEMALIAGIVLPYGVDFEEGKRLINEALHGEQFIGGPIEQAYFEALATPANVKRVLFILDGQKAARKTSKAIRSEVVKALENICQREQAVNEEINTAIAEATERKGSSLTKTEVGDIRERIFQAHAYEREVLILAPTRILARRLARELEDLGAKYYLSKEAADAQIIVACPESAWRYENWKFNTIIIDEAHECQQRILQGDLGNHPVKSRQTIHRLLKEAGEVVLAQDGIPQATTMWAMRVGGFSVDEVVIERRQRPHTDMTVRLYLDDVSDSGDRFDGTEGKAQANDIYYTWLNGIVSRLDAGEKVLIPCGAQERARHIARMLRHIYGSSKKVQVLDGKYTPTRVKAQVADNPDEWIEDSELDVLIYTPVFNSGVSIETKYFDAIFEALAVGETSSAASQRGERDRDAIFGERIKERHVYLSNRGMAAMPDPRVFTPGYWRTLLQRDADKPFDDMASVAQALGMAQMLNEKRAWARRDLDAIQELPELLAIEARQIHFKRQCLEAEWRGNEWDIQYVEPLSAEELKPLRESWEEAREEVLQQRARMRALARPVEVDDMDDPDGPLAMVRGEKFALAEKVGHDYERINQAEFWSAWGLSTGTSGGIDGARVQALIRMALEAPQLWHEVRAINQVRAIAGVATTINLPKMPVTPREIETAELLLGSEAVAKVIRGDLELWDKAMPEVEGAAAYARTNALELARLSKHSQRIHGLQFTEATPDIKCFHKLLQMAGVEAQTDSRQGSGQRLWQYRVILATDVQARIDKRQERGQQAYDLQRQLYRINTAEELVKQTRKQIGDRLDELRGDWIRAGQILGETGGISGGLGLQLKGIGSLSETLDGGYSLLAAVMQTCQSWQDFEAIGRYFPVQIRQGVWDWMKESQPGEVERILHLRNTAKAS